MVLGGEGRIIHEGEIKPAQAEQVDNSTTAERTNEVTEKLLHPDIATEPIATAEPLVTMPPVEPLPEDKAEPSVISLAAEKPSEKVDVLFSDKATTDEVQEAMAKQFAENIKDMAA